MRHDTTFLDDLALAADQYSVGDADREERSHDWGTAREDGVRPDVVELVRDAAVRGPVAAGGICHCPA